MSPEFALGPNMCRALATRYRFSLNFDPVFGAPANTFYQPECTLGDADHVGHVDPGDKLAEGQSLNAGPHRRSPPLVVVETCKAPPTKAEPAGGVTPSAQCGSTPAPEQNDDEGQRTSSPSHTSALRASPPASPPTHTPLTKVVITRKRCYDVVISLWQPFAAF